MTIGDNNYGIDCDGNRVLIGLSAEETNEFIKLERLVRIASPMVDISPDKWPPPNERRWLELLPKASIGRRTVFESDEN